MRPHRFEAVPLVFGLLFIALGLVVLRGDADLWRLDWSWFWPGVLTLAGVLVLLSARSDTAAQRDDGLSPETDHPTDSPIDPFDADLDADHR